MFTSTKCACQTIKKLNRRIFKHPYYTTESIGNPALSDRHEEVQKIKFRRMIERLPHCSIVSTTRNPLKRVISCYNYMIVGRHQYLGQQGGRVWFKEKIESTYKKHIFDVTFREFIDYIYNTPDRERDIHFSTQSYMIEDIEIDFIVNVESFNKDMQRAIDKLSLPLVIPKIHRNKTNYFHFDKGELTTEVIEKVNEIYKEDFKKFKHTPISLDEIKEYIEKKSFRGPLFQGCTKDSKALWPEAS